MTNPNMKLLKVRSYGLKQMHRYLQAVLRLRIRRIYLFFGPPGSGSISQRYGSGSGYGSLNYQAKIVKITLIPTVL